MSDSVRPHRWQPTRLPHLWDSPHYHNYLGQEGLFCTVLLCILAWRIPGMGEPGRLPSMGLHRVRLNWSDLAAAAADILRDHEFNYQILWRKVFFELAREWFNYCCWVAKLCPPLHNPMDCSTPGSSILHCLPEFAQIHVHWVGDAIQPSHPLSPPSLPALNVS